MEDPWAFKTTVTVAAVADVPADVMDVITFGVT
jgi:hypothetical protein